MEVICLNMWLILNKKKPQDRWCDLKFQLVTVMTPQFTAIYDFLISFLWWFDSNTIPDW